MILCKLFVLDRNTLYYINAYKQMINFIDKQVQLKKNDCNEMLENMNNHEYNMPLSNPQRNVVEIKNQY